MTLRLQETQQCLTKRCSIRGAAKPHTSATCGYPRPKERSAQVEVGRPAHLGLHFKRKQNHGMVQVKSNAKLQVSETLQKTPMGVDTQKEPLGTKSLKQLLQANVHKLRQKWRLRAPTTAVRVWKPLRLP